MSRTVAHKTLPCLAVALLCAVGQCTAALANTGGAGVPHKWHTANSSSAHHLTSHRRNQIATWFGPGFYGKKTACGQTLTPAVVGIASRTLPCGTLVLVAYGGHRLTVPVIDRGPYGHSGAVWDLTRGAADALSIEDTVRVETKVVGHAANTPLLGAPAEAPPVAGAAVAPSG